MTQDSARKEVDRERNCTPLNFFSENHKASNNEKTKLLILDTKKPVGVQLGYKKYVPQWGYSPQKTLRRFLSIWARRGGARGEAFTSDKNKQNDGSCM
jgi:hypothetical protein